MSMNFYAFGPFPGGGDDGEGLHIGQRAAGHRFLMRSHPDLGLTTLAAWMGFVRRGHVVIRSEGGLEYTPAMLEALVRDCRTKGGLLRKTRRVLSRDRAYHVDPEGVEFYASEFC